MTKMKDPLKDYNLNFDNYPNWKQGLIYGLSGGIISAICIDLPLLIVIARMKSQTLSSNYLFCAGVFLFYFFIFGSYGAFKPPKS